VYKTLRIFFSLFTILFVLACEDEKEKNPKNTIDKTENSSKDDTFSLSSLVGEYYTVTVSNEKVTFKESSKGIVLVSFFATWCIPCRHEIPYLNDLQTKYKKDLLVMGVLVHDKINTQDFNYFVKENKINYYISNTIDNNAFASLIAKTLELPKVYSIPLTVMYVEGEYFTHYEGSVPIEMIAYDIEQAQERLK
jgi:thiol-disulfide isomerase/thioredoxin